MLTEKTQQIFHITLHDVMFVADSKLHLSMKLIWTFRATYEHIYEGVVCHKWQLRKSQ